MKTHGKKLLIIAFLGFFIFLADAGFAQTHRGARPSWTAACGQRAQQVRHRHIYFPEYNFYYDLHRDVYIYLERGGWKITAQIPRFLRFVDLGNSVQMALVINTNTPFFYNREHVRAYFYEQNFDGHNHQCNGHHNSNCKKHKGC